MKDVNKQFKLNELLLHALESDMEQTQIDELNALIVNDPDSVKDYLEFIDLYSALSPYGDVGRITESADGQGPQTYDRFLQSMAQEEITAPNIKLEPPKPISQRELIQKVEREKIVYKMSKSSILTLVVSLAACLFIVLFLRITPHSTIEVATITDSVNAVFSDGQACPIGSRLTTRAEPIWLQKGIISLTFDYGAQVVIEAPAEFTLNTADDMTLRSGRLYAHIPDRSKGFKVETPTATVIDLGTEFAVKADFDGSSDIHLFKGKASLIPGAKGRAIGSSQILTVNQARRITLSGNVEEIPAKPADFVHGIDSRTGLIWRGQTEMDLADIICGGNGFGSGDPTMVIVPTTGSFTKYVERGTGTRYTKTSYSNVESLKYIDGVFVPNGISGPVIVSSEGTLFMDCPPTSGYIRKDITVLNSVYNSEGGALRVDNIQFGYPGQPAISMHANIGITFDLNAIRNDLKDFEITSFEAVCAIAQTKATEQARAGKADFWILVDGELKKSLNGVSIGFSESVKIPINPEDRFLTIMTTDHLETAEGDPIHSDRCFLGKPVLGISRKE
jgi:hypothetical protein